MDPLIMVKMVVKSLNLQAQLNTIQQIDLLNVVYASQFKVHLDFEVELIIIEEILDIINHDSCRRYF